MRFAVGYQLANPGEESFVDVVADYRGHVAEVYFPWLGAASGRAALGRQRGAVDWTAQHRFEDDLVRLCDMGVKLDLLFNANCYGGRAISEHLQNEVGSTVEHLHELVEGPDIVTTTSPFVAHVIKTHFPDIEVRASVNMRLGSAEAMHHVADLFDSFYIQRDVQRDLSIVRQVRAWCDANGKGLCMLANSGCLRFCPGQTFHDNMVAHDGEIDEQRNLENFLPHICWRRYQDKKNRPAVLQSTWVRPEDLRRYEGLVDVVKLATRMHSNPRMVLEAYTTGSFHGNLLDLFEPSFSRAFAPWAIDNDRFPENWFDRISTCSGRCTQCRWCEELLVKVLVKYAEDPNNLP